MTSERQDFARALRNDQTRAESVPWRRLGADPEFQAASSGAKLLGSCASAWTEALLRRPSGPQRACGFPLAPVPSPSWPLSQAERGVRSDRRAPSRASNAPSQHHPRSWPPRPSAPPPPIGGLFMTTKPDRLSYDFSRREGEKDRWERVAALSSAARVGHREYADRLTGRARGLDRPRLFLWPERIPGGEPRMTAAEARKR